MELVLIAAAYKRIVNRLEKLEEVSIGKVKPPHIYFTYDKDVSNDQAISELKQYLKEDIIIKQFVFEIFGFYNNKIDIASYLPEDVKNKSKYYQ